jgi:hypothetical protein
VNFDIIFCKIIDIPKVEEPRGKLTFVKGGTHIPYDIKRVYYLYDVLDGTERGGSDSLKSYSTKAK